MTGYDNQPCDKYVIPIIIILMVIAAAVCRYLTGA